MPTKKATRKRSKNAPAIETPAIHLVPAAAIVVPVDPFDPSPILGDVGAAKWQELAPQLLALCDRQGQPLLDLITRDLLASYCVAWESLVESNEELREAKKTDSLYFGTRGGGLTPHPAFTIRKAAQAELRIAGKLLGLNPDARHKLKPSKPGNVDDDPVAAAMMGK